MLTAASCAQASHPLVTLIEARVTQVVSEAQTLLDVIDRAPENAPAVSFVAAEPLQVVRYTVSQGYVQHFDNRSGSQARKGALRGRALLPCHLS